MSYMENMSSEGKNAIEELRMNMKGNLQYQILDENLVLYKFLKARDFDVNKAEVMLRKTLAWRKALQVDNILQDFTPKPFFEKYPKLSHIGLDKDGDMVKYVPVGKMETKDIVKCVKMNNYMKHWIWHCEEMIASMVQMQKETGKTAFQIVLILNLDKLTLANATNKLSAEVWVKITNLLQDNYPESLKSIYVINAPAYYVFIFSILKSIMSNAMLKKIRVYGYSGWQEKFLENIDADVLPAFLGGNRTDPDGNPLCTSFVTHGGRIPEIYYLPDEERDFKDKSQVKRTKIPKREKKEIPVLVSHINSRIYWEFLVKSKDIGFGLFYQVSEQELEEILPIQRYDTPDGVEEGSYKCQSTGKYIILFDNSYSWMNSKEIEYCITMLKPEM